MKDKRVGWCRIKEELVLEEDILLRPYLKDDMDVYMLTTEGHWGHWTPEGQYYNTIKQDEVPEMIQLAVLMLS